MERVAFLKGASMELGMVIVGWLNARLGFAPTRCMERVAFLKGASVELGMYGAWSTPLKNGQILL